MADDRRPVERAGQVGGNRVEQALDAHVLEARPAEDGLGAAGQGGAPQGGVDHLLGQLGAVEVGHVLLGEGLIEGREGVEHRLTPGLGVETEVRGNVVHREGGAQVLGLEVDRLHGDQVDQTLEFAHGSLGPGADGDLNGDRVAFQQAFFDLLVHPIELGADAVHLVDEAEPGDMIFGRLPPDRLALGLDPLDRREDHDGSVEHAQRPFDLGREIDVSRRIDDVDRDRLAVLRLPAAGDGRRHDGDAALTLLFQVIGGGVALVHVSHPVDLAGVVEDSLGGRRLAGVDVGDDADVADPAEVCLSRFAGHVSSDPVSGETIRLTSYFTA